MLAHQRLADRETVKRTLGCLQSMSDLHQDVLAVKCVALLGDLLAIEEDAAHGSKSQHPQTGGTSDTDTGRNVLIMRVPYLGAIQISLNGIANVAPLGTKQDLSFGEGVTIGGIGSLHVNSPVTAARANDGQPAEVPANNPAPLWTSAAGTLPGQHDDEVFPDAARVIDSQVLTMLLAQCHLGLFRSFYLPR